MIFRTAFIIIEIAQTKVCARKENPMFSDFHLHSEFSMDSETPARAQIEQAIALGMKELCFTDHHDYATGLPTGDYILDFESYFSALKLLREEYKGRIHIGIGVELGLQQHIKDYLEQLSVMYPFDYIIGSNHFIDQMDPYFPEFFNNRDEKDAYREYFQVSLARLQTIDCYDVLGHLDYVVRYGPNKNKYYNYPAYREFIEPILKTLIEKGKGLECNTGGLKHGLGQPNPSEDILKRYRELGGEIITVGSDAHIPEHLGYDFEPVKQLLLECGFRYYTVYHSRVPEFIKIT